MNQHADIELVLQATFRVRAMDRFLNLARLPALDADAAGPHGFQVGDQHLGFATMLQHCL